LDAPRGGGIAPRRRWTKASRQAIFNNWNVADAGYGTRRQNSADAPVMSKPAQQSPCQTLDAPLSQAAPRRRGLIRRLYDWVLHWAETPYGTPALFVISFMESSVFPIPPDVLQIALSVSKPRRSFFYAGVSAVASVLGGIFGWLIGFALWAMVGEFFYNYVPGVSRENVAYVGGLYQQNAFWSIFAAAFTPIPFKVFTISAGIFHEYVSLITLIVASALGRSARFFLVAGSIYFFGPSVRSFIEKRLELITIVLFVLMVLGFLAIKYLVH
jgi:membrane protein YqaA with SNARE-associated domain